MKDTAASKSGNGLWQALSQSALFWYGFISTNQTWTFAIHKLGTDFPPGGGGNGAGCSHG